MDMDVSVCIKRNIHNRAEKDIEDIVKYWEETPRHYLRVDIRSLLQSAAITEVSIKLLRSILWLFCQNESWVVPLWLDTCIPLQWLCQTCVHNLFFSFGRG